MVEKAKKPIKELEKKVEKKEAKVEPTNWFKIQGETKSKEEFCDWLKSQVTEAPVVKAHHGTWQELIEWENGNQFSYWDSTKRMITAVNLSVRKKTVVINLMKPLNETIEGKLNFFHQIVGVPESGDSDDIFGSQVATQLVDYNDYVNNHDELMEEVKYDLLRPGIACKKWWWDEDAKGMVAPMKDGKPDTDKAAAENGEVIGEVVPIFNIRPDPTAKTQKKLRWVIEIKEVTVQELYARFPKKIKADIIQKLRDNNPKHSEKVWWVVQEEKPKDADTFVLREYWEKPNRDYKEGRYIVSCQGEILYAGINPNPRHQIPYFFYFFKKSPYSFWPNSPLHYIQPIQREFNRMISLISEHIEAWKPKMAVAKGALKRARSLTIESFEIVEVDYSRGEPKAINMPELSAQVTAYRDFLISSVDRVSNVHEVSYSRLPQYASRAPASLYAMMLEQENLKLDPMIKRTNKTILDEAKFRLELMDQHYTMPRLTKIVGKNREASVAYYSKAQLNQSFDVRLEVGVSLNQSPTIQQRLLLELWNSGILEGRDRLKIMKMLNLGTAEHELRSDMADTERAMRENQAILDGTWEDLPDFFNIVNGELMKKPSKVFKHDDHETHLDMITTLIKTEEYTRLSDEAKAFALNHAEEHYYWWQMAMASMMAAQGGGPGMGTPAAGGAMGPGTPGAAGAQPGGTQTGDIEGFAGPGGG